MPEYAVRRIARRTSIILLGVAVAAWAHAAAGAVPSSGIGSAPSPKGTLFIVGGGEQPKELVQAFVDLAGGTRARIAVVPTATEESAEAGKEKVDELRGYGAQAFVIDVSRAEAQSDSIVKLIGTATGIWFGGGDQVKLADSLVGTAALRAMLARYEAGAVVGGTSAGAAVLSDSMITGNQKRPDADSVGYYGDEFPNIARGAIQIKPGFGFIRNAIVDMHFIRRERANRLLEVVLERPSLLGVGIDEGTAVRVDPDGKWTVLGRSAAIVLDARDARVTGSAAPRLGASGVHLSLLPAGSTYDPRTGRATLPTS
ncbi:MAG TPA: cyanophycinase [Gemmatimonadaceae bacterium]|nr:cyanophycinase [Gemmatimonadaceae bacterium]